jgi:EAL domain-containing protein (putative c-di-GMP-specific phosphodiesterase class I)
MLDQYKIFQKNENEAVFCDLRIETLFKNNVFLNKNFAVLFILSSSSIEFCFPNNCLGQDDFLIQFENSQAIGVLQKIDSVSVPRKIEEIIKINNDCNIGVAISPMHGTSMKELMSRAFQAALSASAAGKKWEYFNENKSKANQIQKKNNKMDLAMCTCLEKALANDEFYLDYQGQVNSRTGALVCVEALIRWQPEGSAMTIPPNEFIPFAEKNDLISKITDWVLMKACQQGVVWQAMGKPVRIAVNISPKCFLDERFLDSIEKTLDSTGLPAELLEIEITESNKILDIDQTNKILQHLKSLGVRITLDDFGKDHSFLKHLSFLCVDKIKIDQQFIQNITCSDRVLKIVQSIIGMSRRMGIQCLAEGVETVEQAALLEQAGCFLMQGFLWHKPGATFPDWENKKS